MKQRILKKGNMRFIKAWTFPGPVEEFIKERLQGFTVHVCSGSSGLGDLKIDKYLPADIIADMCKLPLETGIADTVICDPPWETPKQLRHLLLFELRRILKLGGTLIFNAIWVPRVPGLELKEVWASESLFPNNNCGLISIMTKIKADLFSER